MSWKAEARRIYEERILRDSLARLAERRDLKGLPLSSAELRTLAKRSRESFRNPDKHAERLARYKAQLAKQYGTDLIGTIAAALAEINNEIGYEEK